MTYKFKKILTRGWSYNLNWAKITKHSHIPVQTPLPSLIVHFFWSRFQPKQMENEYKLSLNKSSFSEVVLMKYRSYSESMKNDKGVQKSSFHFLIHWIGLPYVISFYQVNCLISLIYIDIYSVLAQYESAIYIYTVLMLVGQNFLLLFPTFLLII